MTTQPTLDAVDAFEALLVLTTDLGRGASFSPSPAPSPSPSPSPSSATVDEVTTILDGLAGPALFKLTMELRLNIEHDGVLDAAVGARGRDRDRDRDWDWDFGVAVGVGHIVVVTEGEDGFRVDLAAGRGATGAV